MNSFNSVDDDNGGGDGAGGGGDGGGWLVRFGLGQN